MDDGDDVVYKYNKIMIQQLSYYFLFLQIVLKNYRSKKLNYQLFNCFSTKNSQSLFYSKKQNTGSPIRLLHFG